jgi:hypothetical protein
VPSFLTNDVCQWTVACVLGGMVGCLAALLSVVSNLLGVMAFPNIARCDFIKVCVMPLLGSKNMKEMLQN